jgi:hypothetical protein
MNQENQNQILAAEMTREQEFQHLKMRILQEELFCSKNWLVIFHNSRLETLELVKVMQHVSSS